MVGIVGSRGRNLLPQIGDANLAPDVMVNGV